MTQSTTDVKQHTTPDTDDRPCLPRNSKCAGGGLDWQILPQDAVFLLTVVSFLLTVELLYLQLCLGAFLLTARAFFTYSSSFFAYSWASLIAMGKCVYPPPQKKLLTQKNSWGIIFGVIATVSRNQLRKKILWEIFSWELRKSRVTQHGRVWGLCGRVITRKIILGELISW